MNIVGQTDGVALTDEQRLDGHYRSTQRLSGGRAPRPSGVVLLELELAGKLDRQAGGRVALR